MNRISIRSSIPDSDKNLLFTHPIVISLNGKDYESPFIVAHQNEVEKAKNVSLDTYFLSFIVRKADFDLATNDPTSAITDCNNFFNSNPDRVISFSYQFKKDSKLSKTERKRIHKIQLNSPSPFLCDYELSANQSSSDFKTQFSEVIGISDKIPVATLDIGMDRNDYFKEKLEFAKKKCKRIDIIHRAWNATTKGNWLTLIKFLNNNPSIWCNIVNISSRCDDRKISNLTTPILLGAHSCGLRRGYGGGKLIEIPVFNPNTHYFELQKAPAVGKKVAYNDSWIISVNLQIRELNNMKVAIGQQKLYTDFAPKKQALDEFLKSL